MDVTTTKTDDLNAVLTVKIDPDDYRQKVEDILKDYRKKANIPGFRPGKVPTSLIKKQYGKAVLIDEVNNLLQKAVNDYLQKEDINILGNPLPVPDNSIDWETQEQFSFDFELGLAPDFDLKIDGKLKVPYYKIVADKKLIDRYARDYARRFGTMRYPEVVTESAILKARFTETDAKGQTLEEGIRHEGSFSLEVVDDKKARKALTGLKVGDQVELNLKKIFEHSFNVERLLEVDAKTWEESKGHFALEITEISELEPAPINQELFDKLYGEGEVKSEEEFRQRIKEQAERSFSSQSDQKFLEDLKEKVLSKTKIELPDAFMKKWLKQQQDQDMAPSEIEEEYPLIKDRLKWQIVENRMMREHELDVDQQELIEYAAQMVKAQMMQYGQMPSDEDLQGIVMQVLQNREEGQRIADQLMSDKLLKLYKETVKLDEKEVSFDEFLKK